LNAILQTCDTHTMAPIQRIPDHRPVCNGYQGLWEIFRIRCEGVERYPRTAEDQRLQAGRRQRCVRHAKCWDDEMTKILSPAPR
jgi:hypothetical protein